MRVQAALLFLCATALTSAELCLVQPHCVGERAAGAAAVRAAALCDAAAGAGPGVGAGVAQTLCARARAALAADSPAPQATWVSYPPLPPPQPAAVNAGGGGGGSGRALWRALLASGMLREPLVLQCALPPLPLTEAAAEDELLRAVASAATVTAGPPSAAAARVYDLRRMPATLPEGDAVVMSSVLLPGLLASPLLQSVGALLHALPEDNGAALATVALAVAAPGTTHRLLVPLSGRLTVRSAELAVDTTLRSGNSGLALHLLPEALVCGTASDAGAGLEVPATRLASHSHMLQLQPPPACNSNATFNICTELSALVIGAGCVPDGIADTARHVAVSLQPGQAVLLPAASYVAPVELTMRAASNSSGTLLWLDIQLEASALFAGGGGPALSASELTTLQLSGAVGSSRTPRAVESLLRYWLETPYAITLLELLQSSSMQATVPPQPVLLPGSTDDSEPHKLWRQRLLARRPGLGAVTAAAATAADGNLATTTPPLTQRLRSVAASCSAREQDDGELAPGELVLAHQLLASLAARTPDLNAAVVSGTAGAVATLSWDYAAEPPPHGYVLLLAATQRNAETLGASRARVSSLAALLAPALSVHSLADELARTTVRDIEELMLAGQAMLEAATSPGAAAALLAIRRVLVQRLRDAAEQPSASASASPSASPTPTTSAVPQLLVTAELHPAGETDIAWDFIAHMQSVATATSRENMTAALAILLAGSDEPGILHDDERALLQAFADDVSVYGLDAALAGLALRTDLTNWAACVSAAAPGWRGCCTRLLHALRRPRLLTFSPRFFPTDQRLQPLRSCLEPIRARLTARSLAARAHQQAAAMPRPHFCAQLRAQCRHYLALST